MIVNYDCLSSGRDTLLKNDVGFKKESPPLALTQNLWLVVLALFLSVIIGQKGWAQSTANYAFSTNALGSLALDMNGNAVDMSAGTTTLVANSLDQSASAATNIGFNYPLMGNVYSQFSASSNGIIQLGSTAIAAPTATRKVKIPRKMGASRKLRETPFSKPKASLTE